MSAISRLSPAEAEAAIPDLAEILHASVLAGASVGFIVPFALTEAAAYWRNKVLPVVGRGTVLLAARLDGGIVGTAQLDHDTMPNQPHRADVKKVLVHPAFRRRGIARALMLALEAEARARGRFVLTLDTRPGDGADALYASLGYHAVGRIPDFCRDTLTDRLDPTLIMAKRLAG